MLKIDPARITGNQLRKVLDALMFNRGDPEQVKLLWRHLLWIEEEYDIPDEDKVSVRLNEHIPGSK